VNDDGIITLKEAIFLFFFVVLVFGVPALVVWASYAKRFASFDMSTLWVHQDRIDKFAVVFMGTWWIHSCSMILWALLKTVQTQDYVTYMGWGIAILAKMWAPKSDSAPEAVPTPPPAPPAASPVATPAAPPQT
jgi:hypothetical protein